VSSERPLTVLCIATYEKGQEFMRECRRQGCRVLLLTLDTLEHADWPRESIDQMFYLRRGAPIDDIVKGVSWMARTEVLDRIVALDDFDVETAAFLREHLRVPGMGDSTARYFRDKLAMRVKANDHGIRVPPFAHVLNYDALRAFMARVPGPWVLKPRSEASAVGITKIERPEDLWPALDTLGDRQSFYVLEKYVPGDVYHVDAIVWDREPVFMVSHKYGQPPMDVAHGGGIFMTRRLHKEAPERPVLEALTGNLLATLGFVRGVSHTEFIRGREDGEFYFLETAARVGGAHITDVVEAATGVNLWAEWARLEIAGEGGRYRVAPARDDYAGIVLSLARDERPDTTPFNDPEIWYRVGRSHHIGFVVASPDYDRVEQLLADYSRRIAADHLATAPVPDKPSA
jgi:hypothetical protein